MSNIILLAVCLFLGVFLRRIKALPKDNHLTLNALIVNVFIPAITLRYTVEFEFTDAAILPIAATWIVFITSYLFFNFIQKKAGFDRQTTGALIVVAGISSISFVGFPIFELLYGVEGL